MVSRHKYVCGYIRSMCEPSCMCTHILSIRAHAESMHTHTRPKTLTQKHNVDIVFFSPSIYVSNAKNSKYINFLPWSHENI